jgi:hypothetical protein
VSHGCATVAPFVCDDGRRDTTDSCIPGPPPSCRFACNNNSFCDDGNACNGAETCNVASGTCVAGTAPDCNDGNDCTDDSCDRVQGCVHTAKQSYDGVGCALGAIENEVGKASTDDLSGPTARKIGKALAQAQQKLAAAQSAPTAKKKKKLLNAAKAKVAAIEKAIGGALAKNKINPQLADRLLASTGGATDMIAGIISGLGTGGH